MTENRVVALRQKGAIDDPLAEILRTGARRLIAQAVEAEFETFLASTAEFVLPDGPPNEPRFQSSIFDTTLPNCNDQQFDASDHPVIRESSKWEDWKVSH